MTDPAPINDTAAPNQQQQMDTMLSGFLWPVIINTINGILFSWRQLPVDMVTQKICFLLGKMIGQTLSQGDLSTLLTARKTCIDQFNAGVRSINIEPEKMPAGMTRQ